MTDLDDRFRSLKRIPAPDLWSDITDRPPTVAPPTRGARRWVAAIVAATVAVAGLAVTMVAFRGEPDAVAPPTSPPVSSLRGEIAATIRVGEDPRSVVYGAGSVWVAVSNNDGSFGGLILRIDPVTNQIIAEIPVETIPTWEVGGGAMIVEGDSLWITGGVEAEGGFESPGGGSDAAVTRIDVTTNQVVDLFTLEGTVGADLAFLDGDLWVLSFGDASVDHSMQLVRVDHTTGEVLTRIPLTSGWAHTLVAANGRLVTYEGGDRAVNVGGRLTFIDAATGAITWTDISPIGPVAWQDEVWASAGGRFARFDISTGEVIDRSSELDPKRLSPHGLGLEADDRAIWFLGYNGLEGGDPVRLAAFDPAAEEVTELATLRKGNPVAMAVAPESVWILHYEGTLTKVDLSASETPTIDAVPLPDADPQITASIPVGGTGNSNAILYAQGSVWVRASFVDGGGGLDDAMLFRIDGTTNEILAEIPIQGASGFVSGGGGLAYGFGSVWSAGYDHINGSIQAVVHRIDPADNIVAAIILLGGTHGADVAVDHSSVWVAYFGEEHASVARIDPETDTVTAQIPLPSDYVRRITTVDGGVVATELEWDGNQGPCMVLTVIDPTKATITARERVHPPCGSVDLFAWNNELWASSAALQRIDPTTARLIGDAIPFEPEHSPRSFVFGTGREVWFAAYPGGNGVRPDRVARLDAATGEIEYFIEAGGIDAVFAPDARTIWILEYGGSLIRVDINDA